MWGPLGEFVIAGHENGEINQISAKVKHRAEAQVAELAHDSYVMWCVSVCHLLAVWGDPEESQGALQAHQRHPDLSGPDHVHQRLQGQHCKGENLLTESLLSKNSAAALFSLRLSETPESIVQLFVFTVSLQLFDSSSLDHIKTFKTERPVNSAAISPIMDHVRGQIIES